MQKSVRPELQETNNTSINDRLRHLHYNPVSRRSQPIARYAQTNRMLNINCSFYLNSVHHVLNNYFSTRKVNALDGCRI